MTLFSFGVFLPFAIADNKSIGIILIGLVMVRETNRQLHETAEKNERNQNAIMRLLDEILRRVTKN